MSSQKGNIKRTRPQKHQNTTAFKNNLHDTSHKTIQLNKIEISNVCLKCKNILAWRKIPPPPSIRSIRCPKSLKTCTKCKPKTVNTLLSYYNCSECAQSLKVCPKCGKNENAGYRTYNEVRRGIETRSRISKNNETNSRKEEESHATLYKKER
ncbi:hypothetical protein L9F63_020317 [Diploptera punctata]|uniref:Uncharacterized protein n=1 Tax=Diploptera punctata TaxID=6984 RepID=A0AAD7ZSY2_DIPPU|nr:hypothetical protein L9F63_020317 [Diploptera punctata]